MNICINKLLRKMKKTKNLNNYEKDLLIQNIKCIMKRDSLKMTQFIEKYNPEQSIIKRLKEKFSEEFPNENNTIKPIIQPTIPVNKIELLPTVRKDDVKENQSNININNKKNKQKNKKKNIPQEEVDKITEINKSEIKEIKDINLFKTLYEWNLENGYKEEQLINYDSIMKAVDINLSYKDAVQYLQTHKMELNKGIEKLKSPMKEIYQLISGKYTSSEY